MPGGRPTKYSPDVVKRAQEYLDGAYLESGYVIPSEVGLSLHLGVARITVQTWGKDENKPEFSAILGKIKAKQHELLISNGLTGEFNSAIAKLVLGKHGYSEKTENTHQGPGGAPLTLNFQGVNAKDG